ncbi:winged helix-turn-helix domain-containing protein [Microvirga sp. VF16]|uniref:winged helix-turn-helix domain-containing protein n=1 Tax=Microvirga sp. VF16 TaxID=2807101 RepID=UPI00193D89D1|nr:response regulator transcription factor [Microvirga sp. VF16]QRM31369.1 response regulator transcription factor [Microvirga sp. VF16]
MAVSSALIAGAALVISTATVSATAVVSCPVPSGVSSVARFCDSERTLKMRQDDVAIIVLSSRDEEGAKVEALDLGADDYVTKPFGMAELVARIRTALHPRVQRQGAEPLFTHGDLSVDLPRRLVAVRGAEVKLSNKEWDILRLLVLHAGQVVTHRTIMQEVWGPKVDVQYLRIYVRQLRQKLKVRPDQPRHILTETGVGYRLQTDADMPVVGSGLRTEIG